MKIRLDVLALIAAAALLLWSARPADQRMPQGGPTLQGQSAQHNSCVPVNLGSFVDSNGELAGGG